MDIQQLIFDSSAIEELENVNGRLWINFHPHAQFLPEDVRVIIDSQIYSKGTAPRFMNHGNNVIFFANESHRITFLKRMKFSDEWIAHNLLPEQPLAEIIQLFPETPETNEPQRMAL